MFQKTMEGRIVYENGPKKGFVNGHLSETERGGKSDQQICHI